ncbi:FAD-dependent oxidoreductase [Acinetobacter rathckeae]|uniref:FAD-dependent oxidoreductase n=1 Tax=Acinetobacter rathckeae TaxID=2605272 RepID=UPI0018A32769|nr:NAD(P)/FAD-dependent oxidoreductase [Acinetobacter rathckeae]MBF7687265.1 NAD(P)/FAD-dependent oxidoreductase [Acinetobacter rathckeae]
MKNLDDLEQRIQEDFIHLNIPKKSWVISNNCLDNKKVDVVIVGAGMSSLALALALRTEGVQAIIFDKCKEGEEGPWKQPALMQTLRSPKQAIGPALNFPSLTFQAWFKVQFGQKAWDDLDKIPRLQWHDYLQWFKKVTEPNIIYEHELIDLKVEKQGSQLYFQNTEKVETYFASHTVLAMGIDSFSSPSIPKFMEGVSQNLWEHAYDGTDYNRFKGLNIGVIGYSAGAMDSSATALEHGAKSVEILCRCKDLPRVNRGKVAVNSGYLNSYPYWSNEQKWDFNYYLKQEKTPAPHGSTLRVSRHKNAYFNFDEHVVSVKENNSKISVYTQKHTFVFDYLILATGFSLNWSKYAWLNYIKEHTQQWKDVYISSKLPDEGLAQSPYLTTNFEFIAKENHLKSGFSRLYCFNYSAGMSQGPLVGMISGIEQGAPHLAKTISAKIYLDAFDQHIKDIKLSDDLELDGSEWEPALPYVTR